MPLTKKSCLKMLCPPQPILVHLNFSPEKAAEAETTTHKSRKKKGGGESRSENIYINSKGFHSGSEGEEAWTVKMALE